MAIEIKVPALGESVTEATVGQWFKRPGDAVAIDEPLVELETDKVTVEVPAPSAGVLSDIKVPQGNTVAVGAVLGAIEAAAAGAQAGAAAEAPAPQPTTPAPEAARPSAAAAPAGPPASGDGVMPPTPAARKIMHEKGLGPADLVGSGRRGQILKEDANAAPARPAPAGREAAAGGGPASMPVPAREIRAPAAPNDAVREERVPMTRLRQTIARRLKEAQNTAAMLTTFNDADMSAIMKLRNDYKEVFERRHHVR